MAEEPTNGTSTRGRRNTSIACLNCRRRKVKCSSDGPRCSNCRLYDVDCTMTCPGVPTQRSNGFQAPVPGVNAVATDASARAHAETQRQQSPPRRDFAPVAQSPFFDVDFDFTDLADDARVGTGAPPSESREMSLALGATPMQNWPGWIEVDETADLFGTMADVPGDTLPDLAPFDDPFSHTHPQDHRPFSDVLPGALRPGDGDRQPPWPGPEAALSKSISPGPVSPEPPVASGASKDERVRKWSVVTSVASSDDSSNVTEQLTNRLGRLQIAEDGHPRYFGSTSNLYILHHGPKSLHKPNIRDVMALGDAAAAKAGYHWAPDAEYEAELITLFFSWYNALVNVVDEKIFYRERALFKSSKRSDLYSPALENAVYAIGAMVTTSSHRAIVGSADEFFGFRTKAYLDIEIDSPTLATAQALLILSALEAAHSRDSRGWIYVGMAVQIVSDLGLHLDLQQQHVALRATGGSTGNLDEVNTLRINLFWACKTLDTLWGALSGRPTLMGNIINNVPSPVPSRTYAWKHYTNKFSTMTFPEGFDFRVAAHVPVHLASLAGIMGKVSETLYCGVPHNISNLTSFVEDMESELQRWYCALPPALTIGNTTSLSAVYLPCVLELHLQYYDATILLHRPQISASEKATNCQSTIDTTRTSLDKCISSARDVCRILVHYRRRYGLQRIHCSMVHVTMTASLIHVFHLYLSDAAGLDNSEAQSYFSTCIQALGEMGQTYKSALRALDVLLSLRQNWQYAASANPMSKKQRSS